MNYSEKHQVDLTRYQELESAIISSTRQAIQEKGIDSLHVDDLRKDDIENVLWSGSSFHIEAIEDAIKRAERGGLNYLAVRSPEGYPVSIGAIDFEKEQGGAYLWQLATHEELRGLGLGTRLIKEAEQRIVERGNEWARIAVELDNPKAQKLYERLGYEVYGTGKDSWKQLGKDGKEEMYHADVLLMRKRLKI